MTVFDFENFQRKHWNFRRKSAYPESLIVHVSEDALNRDNPDLSEVSLLLQGCSQ
jgi:hypothetical protein